ncbi:MAG TPA: hypothetical protein VKV06_15610 [Acidimicrobiales bacterium]|nr:hypothetical protein [Acidimicrobiales bacterium]
MDRPAPDPAKLLESWMEWERGETTPGKVMSNLKTGGLRDVLEALAAAQQADQPAAPAAEETGAGGAETEWTPVV